MRGEQKRGSDIDILVDFYEVPDLFEFLNFERYLEKILRKKVDLVRKPVLKEELREEILSEVTIFMKRDYKLYIKDILDSILKTEEFVGDLNYEVGFEMFKYFYSLTIKMGLSPYF